MHFNRSQLSLIITCLSLAILVLLLYNLRLKSQEEESYVIEMMLDEELVEELIEEKEMEELAQSDPIESHTAINETAKPSFGNPEPLKTLQELMEEQDALDQNEPLTDTDGESNYAEHLKEMARQRKERLEQLGEKDAKKKSYTNYLKERRTSVSFSLVDRNSIVLPPPIYTCIKGGKVVINIKVDRYGSVTDASFNQNSSNTDDGCLIENAITYAYRARFNRSRKKAQIGTITYIFQGK